MGNPINLKELLSKKSVGEIFHGADAVRSRDHVEIFKNPDASERDNPITSGFYDSIRIGIIGQNIYVWADDVSHGVVSRALKKNFDIIFDYTIDSRTMFTNIDTVKKFREIMDDNTIGRMKCLFRSMVEIKQYSTEKVLYRWD